MFSGIMENKLTMNIKYLTKRKLIKNIIQMTASFALAWAFVNHGAFYYFPPRWEYSYHASASTYAMMTIAIYIFLVKMIEWTTEYE